MNPSANDPVGPASPSGAQTGPGVDETAAGALLDEYCLTCHNETLLERGTVPVAFETLDPRDVGAHAEQWESIVRKMRLGMMPPGGRPRPTLESSRAFVVWLEDELDRAATERPDPGRPAVRRLTESEYVNAVRSLLALDVDRRSLLFPADDVDEQGFATNGDVLSISPALFERYLTAANRISRMAVGDPTMGPGFAAATYETPRLLYQDDRMSEDLPFGSRGGMAIRHYFPVDGEYALTIRLRRMIYDYIVGMREPQRLDVRLDGVPLQSFTVGDAEQYGYPSAYTFFGTIRGDPEWEEYVSKGGDAHLNLRFTASAGSHVVGISFPQARAEPTGVLERRLSGFSLSGRGFYHDNAAVARVDIVGPHRVTGSGDTPSRRALFTCRPETPEAEEPCARQILSALSRRAYRRPTGAEDVETLMPFYEDGYRVRGFEGGIQRAVERLLVSPEFLFRIEADPTDAAPGAAYRLTDLELATRLSLFLWSDIPDEELLGLAESNRLSAPGGLATQVRRLLADDRADALVEDFATAWLQLNRLQGIMPDADVFFEFDENLRADMLRETSLFLTSQLREDRSLLDLLRADYTFVNERLARHYGLSGIHGERFRRVTLDAPERGGLLGHASLLTVTVLSDANVSRPAGEVAAGQHSRDAALAASRRCARAHRKRGRRADPVATPADGAASTQSGLRGLSSRHGPAGLRARAVRRRGAMARDLGWRRAGRCLGRARRRHTRGRAGHVETGSRRVPGELRPHRRREAPDVCAGASNRVLRSARHPTDRDPGGG